MDLVFSFIEACCYIETGLAYERSLLYENYKKWSKDCNLSSLRKRDFFSRLQRYYQVDRELVLDVLMKPEEDWDYWNPDELKKIYFISDGKKIKIGISIDPERRLKSLQTGSSNTLRLVEIVSGNDKLERQLHEYYKDYHERGEWFNIKEELVFLICERIRKTQ
jgi:hypothetical protein